MHVYELAEDPSLHYYWILILPTLGIRAFNLSPILYSYTGSAAVIWEHQILAVSFSAGDSCGYYSYTGPTILCRAGKSTRKGTLWYGLQEHASEYCNTCMDRYKQPAALN